MLTFDKMERKVMCYSACAYSRIPGTANISETAAILLSVYCRNAVLEQPDSKFIVFEKRGEAAPGRNGHPETFWELYLGPFLHNF